VAIALRYMPTPKDPRSAEQMSDREIASDTRNRVGTSANSFDKFTIRLVGSIFNGEEEVVDESGGLIGRLAARVEVLEAGFKAHTRMLLGLGILMLAMTSIEKSKSIVEFLEKLKALFG